MKMEYLFPIVQRAILNVDLNGIFYSICIEACWTLYYIFRALARFAADKVFQYLNAEFSQRLIWLMQNADQELAEAIHQIVQRLALCCEQGLLQVLIDNELLRALNHNLTQVPNPAYQLLASRTIRCIIGSNRNRIQMLFDENLIQPLVQIIQDEELMEEVEVKVEAILIISGVVRNGTDLQIGIMVDLGCIQLVCENLYPLMTRATCFQAMRKIIQVKNRNRVDGVNIYVQEIANFGGDMIRTLQNDAHVGDIARWIMMYI